MAHIAKPATSLPSSHIHQHLHSISALEAKDILAHQPAEVVDIAQNILACPPAEVVDIALSDLQNAGIELIEWRALLQRRMKVPLCINNFSYLVPDDDLERASGILSKLGLQITPPTSLYLNVEGDFRAKGLYHRITRATSAACVQHITLYPLSFSTLSRSELEEKSPLHMTPSRCHSILVPSPPAVYASILRMMLHYPRFCGTMYTLRSDLAELIGYHLLGLRGGYVDASDDETLESLELEQRLADAVHHIRAWGGLWREGEEWVGDALAGIVDGTGDMMNLPCKI